MKNTKTLKIIDGQFTYEDARQILMSLFLSKIDFHIQKNWSSQERYGITDINALIRISALRSELEKIEKILSDPKAENKRLVINSEITISMIEINEPCLKEDL